MIFPPYTGGGSNSPPIKDHEGAAPYLCTEGTEAVEEDECLALACAGVGAARDDPAVHRAEYGRHGVENSLSTFGEAGVSVA